MTLTESGSPLAARWGCAVKAYGVDAAFRAVSELALLAGASGFIAGSATAKAVRDLNALLYADGSTTASTGQQAAPSPPRAAVRVPPPPSVPALPAAGRHTALRNGAAVLQHCDRARLARLQAGGDPPGQQRRDPLGSLVRGDELEPGQLAVHEDDLFDLPGRKDTPVVHDDHPVWEEHLIRADRPGRNPVHCQHPAWRPVQAQLLGYLAAARGMRGLPASTAPPGSSQGSL